MVQLSFVLKMAYHILLDDSNLGTGENAHPVIFKTSGTLSELKEHLNKFYFHYEVLLSPNEEELLKVKNSPSENYWVLYWKKYKITTASPEKDQYIESIINCLKQESNKNKIIDCSKLSANDYCCHVYVINSPEEFVMTKDNLKIMFPLSYINDVSKVLEKEDFPHLQ